MMNSTSAVAIPRLASTILLLTRNPNHTASPPTFSTTALSVAPLPENDIHVLMMKRHGKARFLPNAYVFPGGGVEGVDLLMAKRHLSSAYGVPLSNRDDERIAEQSFLEACPQPSRLMAEAEAWACRFGALRELVEETSCVLQKNGCICSTGHWGGRQRGMGSTHANVSTSSETLSESRPLPFDRTAAERLRPVARWVTPRQSRYRYDTYFYAALVCAALTDAGPTRSTATSSTPLHAAMRSISPQDLPLTGQASEVSEVLWVSPLQAVKRHEDSSDNFSLAPPTYLMLHALACQKSFASLERAWTKTAPAPMDEDNTVQPIGTLPYSSVLPCIEPRNTLTEDGRSIVKFLIPAQYFHEKSWCIEEGRYVFPGENFAELKREIHMRVGGDVIAPMRTRVPAVAMCV